MILCARIQSSHATWCCLVKSVVVRFQHHHVLSSASCVLIHPCFEGFVLVLSFWISSCTCCGTVAKSSLYWHHVHLLHLVITWLLTLLRGFTPASRTKHIQKYSSTKKFIKLPFQRVLIRLSWSPNKGAIVVSLQHCLLSRISACATIGDSTISTCRNLILPCCLIRWNIDFMDLLKIQLYPFVFLLLRLCKSSWWHHNPFVHRSRDVCVVFVLMSFRAPCHASLGFKNQYHLCMSMTVKESFSIMLDMVISETYSSNIQTSKRD
jgi:hypothetical protein